MGNGLIFKMLLTVVKGVFTCVIFFCPIQHNKQRALEIISYTRKPEVYNNIVDDGEVSKWELLDALDECTSTASFTR